jgi:hypothetical protein
MEEIYTYVSLRSLLTLCHNWLVWYLFIADTTRLIEFHCVVKVLEMFILEFTNDKSIFMWSKTSAVEVK